LVIRNIAASRRTTGTGFIVLLGDVIIMFSFFLYIEEFFIFVYYVNRIGIFWLICITYFIRFLSIHHILLL
jgi:hypothetical protein